MGLELLLGKGNPLLRPREFWGVGVGALEESASSSGRVTENMRVMKIVLLRGSLLAVSADSVAGRGSSGGRLEGVYDFARWLLRRRPSARPRELVASCRVDERADGSDVLESKGTMWSLFEFPR